MIAGILVFGALAVGLGVTAGPKWVFAPLLGYAIWKIGTANLRSMNRAAHGGADLADAPPSREGERTLYWCEPCGTELLLVIRGSGLPPRHCGERMHERAELPN